MNNELSAIRDAHVSGDHAAARSLSDAYIAAHPEQFETLKTMTLEQCVQAIDVLRDDAKNAFADVVHASVLGADAARDEWFRIDAWLYHHFEPQNIGGQAEAKVRVNG